MPSKSARMKAMVVNRHTCGGPKKAGLVPHSTAFYGRWFMVRRGTNTIAKKKYPRRCQGSGKTLGMRKSAAAAVDYLQKHLAELNERINWRIPGHAALGWPARMKPRVSVEKKILVIGTIADMEKLLLELGGGVGAYLHTDFWGLQAGNYSEKMARSIKKANNYLAKQPFNLGPHGMGLISQADAALLRENGYGKDGYGNPLVFSFGNLAGKEVEVFSFDSTYKTNITCCCGNSSSNSKLIDVTFSSRKLKKNKELDKICNWSCSRSHRSPGYFCSDHGCKHTTPNKGLPCWLPPNCRKSLTITTTNGDSQCTEKQFGFNC